MSEAFRLGVLIMPSPVETAWRSALVKAASAQGYPVAKSIASFVSLGPDADGLLIVNNAAEALHFRATHWVVISADLQETVDVLTGRSPDAPSKGYRRAAERLATQAWLIGAGAKVLDGAEKELEMPGLGRLRRDEVPVPDTGRMPIEPLNMYVQSRPRIGAKAHWQTGLFFFRVPDQPRMIPPRVDLTGRARVVIHGPRFHLPEGRWQITARFSVDREDSDVYLRFQWGIDDDLETLEVIIQHSGTYEIRLDHAWAFPGEAELRIWATNAHFVGAMEFFGADVEKIGESEIVVPSSPPLQSEASGLPS